MLRCRAVFPVWLFIILLVAAGGLMSCRKGSIISGQEVSAIQVQLLAEGLTSPVGLIPAEDGTGRLFIIDQIGIISIMTKEGQALPEPFIDLRARMVNLNPAFDERGLLGLAFHPEFKDNGRFFVYYSGPLHRGGRQDGTIPVIYLSSR